jgi:outer membrane autotransporter protein
MNKIYRTVWSDARQAFIVASEAAKSRGKPSTTRKAVARAVASALLALGGMAAGPAWAICGNANNTTTIITTETSTCNMATNESLVVSNTGSIVVTGSNNAVQVTGGVTADSIANSGTISGGTNFAYGVLLRSGSTLTGGLTNSGMISSGTVGIYLYQSALSDGLTNSAGGTISGGYGIYLNNSTLDGGLTNSAGGTISGGYTGIYLYGYSTLTGGLTNSGTISDSNTGILLNNNSTLTGGLTNSAGGTISGGSRGIYLYGYSTLTGGLINSAGGTISGGNEGIVLVNHSTLNDGLANSGTIHGGGGGGNGVGIHLVSLSTLSGGLTNSVGGMISGDKNGIELFLSTIDNGLTNNGTISGNNSGILLTAGVLNHGLTNSGMISGGTPGGGPSRDGGIYLVGSTLNGGLVNDGTISGNFKPGIRSSQSHFTGGLINNGTILGAPEAMYLYNGSLIGGLTNNGTISSPGAHGIFLDGFTLVGGLVNNAGGSILSNSDRVIYLSQSNISGGLVNGGTISGYQGIYLKASSTLSGGLTNSGTISVTGAYGIALVDHSILDNDLTNSGTISGDIYLNTSSTLNGSLTNSGAIVGVSGIHLHNNSTLNGSLTNSGTIAGTLAGIYLGSSILSSDLTNSGTISGGHRGIRLDYSTLSSGLTNSGTIAGSNNTGIYLSHSTLSSGLTNGAGGMISGGTVGIHLDNNSTLNGSLANSGTIAGALAAIYLSDHSSLSSGLTNTGTIMGVFGGIGLGSASSLAGGLTNSGTITAAGSIGAGISLTNSTLNGGLTNSGTIAGGTYAIYVDASSNLDAITITGNNTAVFGNGSGGAGVVYAPNTPVTVASGATYTMLNGQHFQVQNFTNDGTLKIGAGSTGTITGDFVNANTGTFSPTVSSMSSYGKLSVTGTATLGGTVHVDVTNGAPLTNGTLTGVIHANGGISGAFASITDNSTLFDFTGIYGANDFHLAIVAGTGGSGGTPGVLDAVLTTNNRPAIGAARALDTIIAGNPGGPIASLFVPLTTVQQVSNAVSQTLPLVVGGSQQATLGALTGVKRLIQARIDANRGMSSGESFYGDKKFWMKPFGSWADQNDRKGVPGYKANTGGLAFGADATVSDTTRLGLSFAYARANVDGNSSVAPSGLDTDVYYLTGYGSVSLDPATEANFQVGVGQNRNRGHRDLPAFGLRASASYDSSVFTAGAGLGRSYPLSAQTRFIPSVRADYTWIKDDGYTETGAGALNLNVHGRKTDELILAVDGKLTHELSEGMTLTANLGVGYDALSRQASITAAYAGAPGVAFTTQGLVPSPWLVRGGLGFVSKTQSGMEVTARYDVEHRSHFLNQTASVKLRWAF